jgi:hypothetical protein
MAMDMGARWRHAISASCARMALRQSTRGT